MNAFKDLFIVHSFFIHHIFCKTLFFKISAFAGIFGADFVQNFGVTDEDY